MKRRNFLIGSTAAVSVAAVGKLPAMSPSLAAPTETSLVLISNGFVVASAPLVRDEAHSGFRFENVTLYAHDTRFADSGGIYLPELGLFMAIPELSGIGLYEGDTITVTGIELALASA